jgi:hypothetical protein
MKYAKELTYAVPIVKGNDFGNLNVPGIHMLQLLEVL